MGTEAPGVTHSNDNCSFLSEHRCAVELERSYAPPSCAYSLQIVSTLVLERKKYLLPVDLAHQLIQLLNILILASVCAAQDATDSCNMASSMLFI